MKAGTNSKAERFGRSVGQMWRSFLREEARLLRWMVNSGVPPFVAKSLLLLVKLTLIAAVVYGAFWTALLLLFAFVAAQLIRRAENIQEPPPVWPPNESDDARRRLFYSPLTHNHDPDPRFHDPRFGDD